jgi:CDP-diacylglycerol---serine O-phosphatidyltransferase
LSEQPPKSHFSMFRVYSVSDIFTLTNAACGTLCIFLCLEFMTTRAPYLIWLAFGFLPVALICDIMDGYVARWRKSASRLGADLDSLADAVSFGVAPAVMGYTLGLRGFWDMAILIYFVSCGISRLARFNVTRLDLADEAGKVRYFEGTPIPSSLAIVTLLACVYTTNAIDGTGWLYKIKIWPGVIHLFTLLYAINGTTMISEKLRIPKW